MYKNSKTRNVYQIINISVFILQPLEPSHLARNELYKKALKAFYKLRKDFQSLNPGIKTSINVYDHTIKPIYDMALKYGVYLMLITPN